MDVWSNRRQKTKARRPKRTCRPTRAPSLRSSHALRRDPSNGRADRKTRNPDAGRRGTPALRAPARRWGSPTAPSRLADLRSEVLWIARPVEPRGLGERVSHRAKVREHEGLVQGGVFEHFVGGGGL